MASHTQTAPYPTERKSPRKPVYCPVKLWGDTAQADGVCLNVSHGGMALAVGREIPEGTLLRVSAVLPGEHQLDATAEVVWARSFPDRRVGLRFLSLAREALASVTAFVAVGAEVVGGI